MLVAGCREVGEWTGSSKVKLDWASAGGSGAARELGGR